MRRRSDARATGNGRLNGRGLGQQIVDAERLEHCRLNRAGCGVERFDAVVAREDRAERPHAGRNVRKPDDRTGDVGGVTSLGGAGKRVHGRTEPLRRRTVACGSRGVVGFYSFAANFRWIRAGLHDGDVDAERGELVR